MKYFYTAVLALLLSAMLPAQLSQSSGPTPPVNCTSSAFVEMTSQTTVQVVAAQANKNIYVCGFVVNSGGATTARLVHGLGTNCATSPGNLTPAFKLTNGTNVAFGGAVGQVLKLPTSRALCLTSSANPDLSVLVSFAQF